MLYTGNRIGGSNPPLSAFLSPRFEDSVFEQGSSTSASTVVEPPFSPSDTHV